MPVDHIRYDLLTQKALRGVVRTVLADVAKNGLPGDHHFFVTFDTRAEGVRLSQRMRTQYPEEMTVVLEHQFWDLHVDDTGFEELRQLAAAADDKVSLAIGMSGQVTICLSTGVTATRRSWLPNTPA